MQLFNFGFKFVNSTFISQSQLHETSFHFPIKIYIYKNNKNVYESTSFCIQNPLKYFLSRIEENTKFVRTFKKYKKNARNSPTFFLENL